MRREFLSALSARSKQAALGDLGTRFAQLGAYLEETPKTEEGVVGIRYAAVGEEQDAAAPPSARADDRPQTADDQAPSLPVGWRALGQGSFMTAIMSVRASENEPDGVVVSNAPARKDPDRGSAPGIETLVLPVRGLNIPFADVALAEGDTIVVEPPREQSVTIVGLVARPGNMPYPPGAHYTLIQALAFAGGLDLMADPRFVSVYRLAPDGRQR